MKTKPSNKISHQKKHTVFPTLICVNKLAFFQKINLHVLVKRKKFPSNVGQ